MGTHPIFESDFDCLTDTMGLDREFRSKVTQVRQKMDEQWATDLTTLKKANDVSIKITHLVGRVSILQRESRTQNFQINDLMDAVCDLNRQLGELTEINPNEQADQAKKQERDRQRRCLVF